MQVTEIATVCLAQGLQHDGRDAWTDSRVTVSLGIARARQVVRVYVDMTVCTAQLDLETHSADLLAIAVREARGVVASGGIDTAAAT